MAKMSEARRPDSTLGQLVLPDFSSEKDLGEALRSHVLNVTTILRAAKVYAEHGEDIHGVEDLIALALDTLDAATEEYDTEESRRREKAGPKAKSAA